MSWRWPSRALIALVVLLAVPLMGEDGCSTEYGADNKPKKGTDAGLGIAGGGGDVDCDQVGHPVQITGSDPNGLDRDNDGIGCEAE